MKILFQDKYENLPEVLLIPILKNDDLKENLSKLASSFDFNIDWMVQQFTADEKECLHLPVLFEGKTKSLFLLGMGDKPHMESTIKTFRGIIHKHKEKLPGSIGLSLMLMSKSEHYYQLLDAAINGLVLGRYRIDIFKTDKKKDYEFFKKTADIRVYCEGKDLKKAKIAAKKGLDVARTQIRLFDLVNSPANKKTPQFISKWAEDAAEKFGYKATIYTYKELKKMGLHALISVGNGSTNPPAFLVLEYHPEQKDEKNLPTIGLVGKGVTFDTGGLSIKPANNMHYMKSDMGGAAAVLGAIELAAKQESQVHVVCIVPVTENSVDANSTKPGDVIDSYSGKTIEVIDTDAEGRLILADGLSYMVKKYNPDVLIDAATLTGSAVRTFGTHAAALFSNNDTLAANLTKAGKSSGEKLWRLPIWDEYKEDLKSDIADVRNYSGRPLAGAIGAAKFLEVFIDEHPNWAHMDIAGMAFKPSEFTSQHTATGFGARLLLDLFELYS